VDVGNLTYRSFRPLLKRAKLPQIRIHDLKHTAATLLLGKGVHPKIVQEMLGHSTITQTIALENYPVQSRPFFHEGHASLQHARRKGVFLLKSNEPIHPHSYSLPWLRASALCHEARCGFVHSRPSGVQVPLAYLFYNQCWFAHALPFFRALGE
jgi:hypothetical protein